ncbi:MAG: bifunctional pyr operon transcriptional regulator/uracil phosphoribosyltransferase PyrR [Burkholderiaceae bacterium]|nr:bifunctional pyr operon transcriptional regulator/uracil phosphoribosyltransferase PyrR [Burkholderiaceae bacterium]MCX7901976.1 bifunctional pyr operon transcriptional regulator/uracil phosphoribosyltransferase PyrR [Burkholderiaceae bacterium]
MIDLDAEAIYRTLAARVRERVAGRDVRLVGIHTGGVWVAERLAHDLNVPHPVGVLDISFYRDDFRRQGLSPTVRPSRIEFDVTGQHLLLVDDVLYTGRTVRAAMNELFDYGRPARIDLAVLVDRGGRELPIEPGMVGATVEVPPEVIVALSRDAAGRLHLTLEKHGARR